MVDITTLADVSGQPDPRLTPVQVEENFTNLNGGKLETKTNIPVQEKITDVAVVAGVVTIDLSTGVEFDVDVDADITDIAFTNTPDDGYALAVVVRFIQDATGGHTIAVPAEFKKVGGTALIFSATANAIDEVAFKIRNKGGISVTAYPSLGDIK